MNLASILNVFDRIRKNQTLFFVKLGIKHDYGTEPSFFGSDFLKLKSNQVQTNFARFEFGSRFFIFPLLGTVSPGPFFLGRFPKPPFRYLKARIWNLFGVTVGRKPLSRRLLPSSFLFSNKTRSIVTEKSKNSRNKKKGEEFSKMITRSNLAEQLREYQIRSKHEWASAVFFSSTSNIPSRCSPILPSWIFFLFT